jgi:hypothetical protein
LSPKIPMRSIIKENPFSIIFTSGTLKPFETLEEELEFKFDHTLENKHVIKHYQICAGILKRGIKEGP